MRQFFSSSGIDHVISRIKSRLATDGRANNISEEAFLYTEGGAARGIGREYSSCLTQRTQLRLGNNQ